MRRREASDDDDDEYGEAEYEERPFRIDRRIGICSDCESDGLGGAPVCDDEEEEEENELEEVAEKLRKLEEGVIEAVPVIQIKQEKKESEPFVIPTIGAFYMHDDRFGDNVRGGRYRWTLGGKRLWQSNDEQKWRHEKFEDLTLQQTHNKEFNTFIEESRTPKGHYQGCSSNGGGDWGNVSRNQSIQHDKSNNQSHSSKVVRGRGPIKYKPLTMSNNAIPSTKNFQTGKSQEEMSNTISARMLLQTSNKRDVQPASINKCLLSSVMLEKNFSALESNACLPGKTVADSIGQNRLYIGGSMNLVAGNHLTNLPFHSSETSSTYMPECSQSRVQRKDSPISAQLSYHSTLSSNKVDGVSSPKQHPVIQQRPAESTVQPSLRVSTKQLNLGCGNGSQASPKSLSPNSFEPSQLESLPGSSGSKLTQVGNRRGIARGSGRGFYPYGGAHGDKNFPTSLTVFPVMQYGAEHDGFGVPAVLPGYAAQSQLDFGNSEMTWLPVLAGTAGTLGDIHHSSYIAADGGFNAHASGQTSFIGVSINETGTNTLNSVSKPPYRPDVVNEEFRQQQIKPQRYSEMKFSK